MKKPDSSFKKNSDDSSGFLLWQVTTLWQRGIKKALDTIDITHPQFVILASLLWLTHKKDRVTQIDLSLHSKIDPMTTSTILKTLQRKELIQRKEHQVDTRAKMVILTEKGISTAREAIVIIENYDAEFFKSLNNQIPEFNTHLTTLLHSK